MLNFRLGWFNQYLLIKPLYMGDAVAEAAMPSNEKKPTLKERVELDNKILREGGDDTDRVNNNNNKIDNANQRVESSSQNIPTRFYQLRRNGNNVSDKYQRTGGSNHGNSGISMGN